MSSKQSWRPLEQDLMELRCFPKRRMDRFPPFILLAPAKVPARLKSGPRLRTHLREVTNQIFHGIFSANRWPSDCAAPGGRFFVKETSLALFFGTTSEKSLKPFVGMQPNSRGIVLEDATISVSDFDRELLKHLSMCQPCRQSSNLSPFLRHPLTPLDPAPTSSPRSFLLEIKSNE